jgi:hypothetical protein
MILSFCELTTNRSIHSWIALDFSTRRMRTLNDEKLDLLNSEINFHDPKTMIGRVPKTEPPNIIPPPCAPSTPSNLILPFAVARKEYMTFLTRTNPEVRV